MAANADALAAPCSAWQPPARPLRPPASDALACAAGQAIKQLLHPATAAKIILCARDDARLPVDMDARAPSASEREGGGADPAAGKPEEVGAPTGLSSALPSPVPTSASLHDFPQAAAAAEGGLAGER